MHKNMEPYAVADVNSESFNCNENLYRLIIMHLHKFMYMLLLGYETVICV